MELTKQGIPHFHAVVPVPKGQKAQQFAMGLQKFATQAWHSITRDSYQVDVSTSKTKTPEKAMGYVLKYVTKDLPRWDVKGMRRYDTSIGFPRVKVGDVHKFGWTEEDGEEQVFNLWEYEQSVNSIRELTKKNGYVEALVNKAGQADFVVNGTGEIYTVPLTRWTDGLKNPPQEKWEQIWAWMKHKDMSYLGPSEGTPSRGIEEKCVMNGRIHVFEFRRRVRALGEHIYRFNRRMMEGIYFDPGDTLIDAWEDYRLPFVKAEQMRNGRVFINLNQTRGNLYLL